MSALAWIALATIVAAIVGLPGYAILRGEPLRVKLAVYAAVLSVTLAITALIVGLVFVATGVWP